MPLLEPNPVQCTQGSQDSLNWIVRGESNRFNKGHARPSPCPPPSGRQSEGTMGPRIPASPPRPPTSMRQNTVTLQSSAQTPQNAHSLSSSPNLRQPSSTTPSSHTTSRFNSVRDGTTSMHISAVSVTRTNSRQTIKPRSTDGDLISSIGSTLCFEPCICKRRPQFGFEGWHCSRRYCSASYIHHDVDAPNK